MEKIRVLIVDDEVQLAQAFKKKLEKEGFSVACAESASEVFPLLKRQTFDVGVLDIKLPDMNGIDLLNMLKEAEQNFEIVMLTGHASIDTAIKSMKLGAYDYLVKPCKSSELSHAILKAYEKKTLKEKNWLLEKRLEWAEFHDKFIGESRAIQEVKRLISLVGASDVPVLITGETGTGKELIARAIHASSQRAAHPFVAINSSTLQESILESELFGYKKGAFTGAHGDKMGLLDIANRGTFFVDEVGDMNLAIQAKLLRVLETGIFMKLGDVRENRADLRFVFATNKRLEEEVAANKFRKDLFYRVNAFEISVPPLRERKEDIPLLTRYFVNKFSKGNKRKTVSRRSMKLLFDYHWPGNVRELANMIERAILVAQNRDEIVGDDFPLCVQDRNGGRTVTARPRSADDLKLDALVKNHIRSVLQQAGGNKSRAARLLGISRKNLYRKIEKGN
ncbi:MAG: sigma-54 dependent transcriptional regulator [Syntrophorhabdales bacterium]|jgi:DNA-binding NtrC family response regulator